MATEQYRLELIFGLIYASGAVVELLVRLSQGIQQRLPYSLERHPVCSDILRAVVFFLLPALLWPFLLVYRILKPLYDVVRECCLPEHDGGESVLSMTNGSENEFTDLEKQESNETAPSSSSSADPGPSSKNKDRVPVAEKYDTSAKQVV